MQRMAVKLMAAGAALLLLLAIVPLAFRGNSRGGPGDGSRPAWQPAPPAPKAEEAPAWQSTALPTAQHSASPWDSTESLNSPSAPAPAGAGFSFEPTLQIDVPGAQPPHSDASRGPSAPARSVPPAPPHATVSPPEYSAWPASPRAEQGRPAAPDDGRFRQITPPPQETVANRAWQLGDDRAVPDYRGEPYRNETYRDDRYQSDRDRAASADRYGNVGVQGHRPGDGVAHGSYYGDAAGTGVADRRTMAPPYTPVPPAFEPAPTEPGTARFEGIIEQPSAGNRYERAGSSIY